MSIRVGLVARADNTGLGNQTLEFYKHMKPSKTLVVDIGHLNGNKSYPERYPDATVIRGFPDPYQIDEFLKDLDVVFVAESPYNYYLYESAREHGVKTAVQYNYEFFDYFVNPNYPKPDMLIAPSQWHYQDIENFCVSFDMKHVYLHCPVNRELLKYRKIKRAKTFLHLAGKPAAHDRNGTFDVIEAAQHIRSDAQIVIHFQGEQGLAHQATYTTQDYRDAIEQSPAKDRITMIVDEAANYADLYSMGDVLLLPRRYGGNCLPMNEALSCGMPVIMPDISPNNEFLPNNWLVEASFKEQFTPRTVIDIFKCDPIKLAAKIDEFAFKNESAMWFDNLEANTLAETIDWRTMVDDYTQALEELCRK